MRYDPELENQTSKMTKLADSNSLLVSKRLYDKILHNKL